MDKSVSAAEANRRFSELLRGARAGHTYTVTSHGRPVARIVPAGTDRPDAERARNALMQRLERQPASRTARRRWTRDELYEDRG